jgi:hypothetical protein
MVDHETMEAEHWLVIPYRHRATRVGKMMVEEGWQIEQVAAVAWRDLPDFGAADSAETLTTPLNWFLDADTSPVQLNFELPEQWSEAEIALRVKASRAVTEWPARTPGRVVAPIAPPTAGFRPLGLALRGVATLKPMLAENRHWYAVPAAQADQQVGVLSRVVGGGTLWLSGGPDALSLETESGPVGGYGVLAYTQNQGRPSGLVQQWHRLLIQPSGPVPEVVLRPTGLPAFNRRWHAWNQAGQAVPMEVQWDAGQEEARVRFRTPIIEPISLVVQQQWDSRVSGNLPLWETPSASGFWGVVDTVADREPGLRVWPAAETSAVVDPTRLQAFRQSSRRGFHGWTALPAFSENAGTELAAPRFEAASDEGLEPLGYFSSLVYRAPAVLRFQLEKRPKPWSSTTIVQATQIDVWSNSVWSTELDVELFLDAADDLVFDLPAQAQVTQVLLNQQPLEWRLSENRLEVSVPRPGRQLLSIVWQTPLQSGFAWGSGLFAVPEAMDLPRLSQPVTRALHLPAGVIPVPSSSPGIETGVSWSRRLISPLAWPDGDLGGLGDNAAAIVSQPVPPAENAVAPGRRVRPQWQLWPLRPASTDGPQWVVVPRDFRLQCWLALLVGWGLASVGSSGSWRAWLPWANPTWLIGGLCLCLTAWAAWPFHYLTSTVLLGFLLGHSWWAAWQVVREQRSPPQSPAAGPPSVPGDGGRQWPSGRSPQGLGSGGRIPATTLGWLGWLLAFAAVAVDPAGLIAMSGAGGPRQEPRSEGSLRTASDEPEGEMPGPFQSVVIPVDADQRPAGNVVYVSPELYRQLSQWTTTQRRSRDLEIRNVQYTLDYDPQLQRFAQLTSQLTCRTQTARHFRLPYAAGQQDAIRQVRVNGVPVVYERFDDRIEIFLDAAANLISITSDLQSTGAVTLSLPGTTDTAINLRGIPSGRYASVTDQERPSFRFLSPTQRRFRVDRMKRVVLQVADQAPATQEPTCELWLTANSQKIDCEMRFSAPRLLGIRRDFYFQVDPRLNLPPGVASEGATWTIDRVPDEQRPSTAAAGPVYRIRFAPDHPPTQRVQVAWDFTGRNFGQLTPPWVQFLDQEGWGIQQWVVLRVAKNLVYHPQDLTMTAYRRASEFEWRAQSGVGNRAAAERGPVGLDRLMTDLNRSGQESIVTNDLFVYQVQNQQARHLGGVLGRLAWQPVQVAGSLQQQVLVDELSARISVKGEIQVVQGELSQWRFRAPAGGKLLQLSWLAGAENLVAWHTRRAGPQYDELVVFLRAPVSGSTRLDCLYEVPIYAAESPELPWISFPSWMDVSQSLQVEIVNLPSWNLLLPNIGAGRETDTTNSTGQATFLISAETTPQIDQVKLVRNGESTVTGSGLYLWDSERMPAVLRLSLGLSSKSSLRKLTLEPIQGLGLPTTVRAVDAAGSGIELSPWQRIDSTFQAELAAPLGTIRVDLEIPVLDGDQEIGLPTVKDGARDLVRYFAVAPGEDAAAVVGGNPAPLLDNGWQVVQPLAATSVWHEQWAAARGWMRIDDSSREPPRLTLRPTPGDNRSAATLGNRFFLRQAVVEQDARQVRIAGVQQMVLQTLGKDEVLIAAPPGVELHHGWLDHHRLPLPAPSNTDPPQIRVPLDPLAEYAVLTWVLSATLTPEQSKLELPHLAAADAKTFSVHLWTADGRVPEPLATITRDATSPTGDEDSGNVAAILEQKYGEPSWLAWSQAAPAVHPLKALEPLRMAPEPSQLAGLEVRLDAAAVDNQRPTSWGAWITGGIGGLLLCVWLAGIVRPFSLPSPAAWGDVVWILLGSVAWFASAELPVVVLFWTIGFSWLALRAFPESFSRRVA